MNCVCWLGSKVPLPLFDKFSSCMAWYYSFRIRDIELTHLCIHASSEHRVQKKGALWDSPQVLATYAHIYSEVREL